MARRQRDRHADRRRGPDRARHARPRPHRGLRRDRHLHAGCAAHARGGVARADPRDRHQRLHAAVRRAHRRVPAPGDPAPR